MANRLTRNTVAQLIARTITAVQRENGTAEDLLVDENEVIGALDALEPVWEELYPAEQSRISGCSSSGSTSRPTVSPSRCMLPGFGASSQSWPARRLRTLRPTTQQ
jgi:hypothetical protein